MLYSLKGSSIDNGSGRPLTVATDEGFGRKGRYGASDGVDGGDNNGNVGTSSQIDRAITGVAFDDQYIVAGGMDGIIRIWEANLKI